MSQARGRAEGVQALLPPRLGDAGGLGPGGAPLLVPARGCRVAGRRHRARRVQAFLPSEGAGTEGSERGRGKGPLLRRCRRFQERQKDSQSRRCAPESQSCTSRAQISLRQNPSWRTKYRFQAPFAGLKARGRKRTHPLTSGCSGTRVPKSEIPFLRFPTALGEPQPI
ncbi:uncharacterized protein LOC144366039 isoform X1 [Ictidomys tridecemlineatus]